MVSGRVLREAEKKKNLQKDLLVSVRSEVQDQPTLQSLLGSVQLLLLLGQLHAELRGGEHVGRAAPLALLQVLAQHVLHLPQQVHLLLELGHLFTQQDCKTSTEKREREKKS